MQAPENGPDGGLLAVGTEFIGLIWMRTLALKTFSWATPRAKASVHSNDGSKFGKKRDNRLKTWFKLSREADQLARSEFQAFFSLRSPWRMAASCQKPGTEQHYDYRRKTR